MFGAFLAVAVAVTVTWTGGQGRASVASEDRASVAFVGDSIGRNAEPEIRANIEPTNSVAYYHAIGAGYTDYHLPLLEPVVEEPDGPDIVVAELGTGDAFWSHGPRRFEADMREFLDAVGPEVDCVVWLDQKPGGNRAYPMINARAEAFNEVVHRVVRDYANATYLHYAAWTELAGAPSPYFLGDYLHLTQAGERELGRLVGNAVRGCDPDLTSGPFWDVQDDFWAADAINWAAAEGLVGGFDNDTYRAVIGQFRPSVTRGQAAQMVWRLGGALAEPRPHGWIDGRPALRRALRWGRASQVLTGYSDNTFRPDLPLTRGAMVTMLWNLAGRPVGFPSYPFTDDTPTWMADALDWAAANGVVTAIQGQFRRDRPVDRAEIAVSLQAADAFLHPRPPIPPAPSTSSPAPPTTLVPTTPVPTTVPPTTVTP